MSEREEKLLNEVQELKAEVIRLKQVYYWAIAILVTGLAIVIPSIVSIVVFVGISIFLALLISPARGLVFPTVFRDQDTRGEPPNSPPSDFQY